MKMLIVDDSSTMRRFLRAFARELGIDTEEAADGREALARLERGADFDVVLVDWDMPRMNGVDFICAARQRPEYKHVKLMMISSHTSMNDVRRALECGADDYLMKPITRKMVAEKLALMGVLA